MQAAPAQAGRARDKGITVQYGIEVPIELHKKLEALRSRKRWSKRALTLEAFERLLRSESDSPSD